MWVSLVASNIRVRILSVRLNTLLSFAAGGSLVAVIWIYRSSRSKKSEDGEKVLREVYEESPAHRAGVVGRYASQDGMDGRVVVGKTGRVRCTPSISSRASTMQRGRRVTAIGDGDVEEPLTDVDCGRLGLQALQNVIEQLEQALHRFRQFETRDSGDMSSASESFFVRRELHALLEQAYSVREGYKQKMILEAEEYIPSSDDSDTSDTDSFVSAAEFIDISDLDDQISSCREKNLLFKAALLELENGNIKYRSVRTKQVGCETDTEYLAKLHCLRQAFNHILAQPERRQWMHKSGGKVMSQLLTSLGYDQTDFDSAFQSMLSYLNGLDDYTDMYEELQGKGIKEINFYDIVFDLLLLDSFQLLSDPPPSLVSVINNRWLTNGFKKTALNSTVWTLLLAKRKLLKYPDGFLSHFYTITAALAPPLAWGFLGPESRLNEICTLFKDELTSYVTNMFSSSHLPFTSVEELADGLFLLTQGVDKKLTPLLNKYITQQ